MSDFSPIVSKSEPTPKPVTIPYTSTPPNASHTLAGDLAISRHYIRDFTLGTSTAALVGLGVGVALGGLAFGAAASLVCAGVAGRLISRRVVNAVERVCKTQGTPLSPAEKFNLSDLTVGFSWLTGGSIGLGADLAALVTKSAIETFTHPTANIYNAYKAAHPIVEIGIPAVIATIATLGFIGTVTKRVDQARHLINRVINAANDNSAQADTSPTEPVVRQNRLQIGDNRPR